MVICHMVLFLLLEWMNASGFLSEASQEIHFKMKVVSMYVHKIFHKYVLVLYSCMNVYDKGM